MNEEISDTFFRISPEFLREVPSSKNPLLQFEFLPTVLNPTENILKLSLSKIGLQSHGRLRGFAGVKRLRLAEKPKSNRKEKNRIIISLTDNGTA